ncbi:ATP-dependent carboxylate-amine ligase domain protein ATP-grasp [Streptomyces davaonensis JCM 4913]|uniref:ATP-dependent carboxylate-amine ligase domain protein ATP-grasp n=1 Tax=Streptomyces davaonensis (strain DSM 101723 / JCM 4913 / KCC S-0913 / 768) TaxID=1214101 RepID=K4R699_STRDJ|nr:ATP-grasp domain-containing protein [Streptomyces davaonensis]CCK28610.1 ATP-dependent carboxylate-amine ligase domain protein ATP-grasp [Streptomyces davaonensis JCM 4913]
MKLLAIEAIQYGTYYRSRYEQVVELGVDVHVLNGVGTDGFWPEDRYRVVGSRHIDDIIAAAREWHAQEDFDGVFTFSEFSVVPVAHVAEALGLPTIGVEAARTSRNKLLMRQAHEEHKAPHPRFRYVSTVDEAVAAAEDFGYPVILKPTLGAASSFVFRLDDAEELRERFETADRGIVEASLFQMEADGVDVGPSGLLIESFLDGSEYLIEAVAWDGEVYLGSVVDRVTVEGATFDDDVHHAPTSLSESQLARVHQAVTAAAHAQGLKQATMHAEVRFHGDEPYILEIAARPGGGGLDHMARLSAGYCPIRATAAVAAGQWPEVTHYTPTGTHTAAMCLICGPGHIEAITVPEEVEESDRLFFFKVTAKPGDLIKRPPEGNSILGFLGATGTSFDDAMNTATDLATKIEVSLS